MLKIKKCNMNTKAKSFWFRDMFCHLGWSFPSKTLQNLKKCLIVYARLKTVKEHSLDHGCK